VVTAIGDARRACAQAVRDSVGVRVVRYAVTDTPAQRWTIDAAPLLEIGGADARSPAEFTNVRGVVRLSDGRIAVANGATNEIRLFNARGAFQIAMARTGAGPAEFTRLFRLYGLGDTLAGVDADTRAQLFTADGRLTRSLRPARREGTRNAQRVGILRDGSTVVVATQTTQRMPADDGRYVYSVMRSTPEGDSLTPLFDLPGYREVRVGQAPSRVSLDGEGTVAARGGRVCAGFANRFDVTCYDPDGIAVSRIVREVPARSITEADRALVRAAYLAANRDAPPQILQKMQQAVQEFPFADRAPAFSRLVLGATGELWISDFDPSTALPGPPALSAPTRPQRWSVFASAGTWLADLVLPARFVAYDMGRDYVAGVSFDGDGAERVTLWRLRR
jgi:hypothetical protein